ncbi:MAG: M20 family metallopeptidase [Armatimonadota bacterium]|nr:M20 family metallopeptidase [Armatimonadota bacterium]
MDDLGQRVVAAIDAARDELIETSRTLHANPEVAFAEHNSAALLCALLERHGYSVRRGVGGLPTAFRAELPERRAGPTVAFLCEYDALPEIGHACGHNLIAAAGVGAGIGIAAVAAELPGRVLVIGTPAEEGGSGKKILLEAGVFADVDAAMMFHPASYTLPERPSLASWRLRVAYHGRASHAAAAPEEGVNALDALIQLFVSIGLLRQQLRDDARIHGIVTYGGAAPNVIPDRAEASFSVRAADDGYASECLSRVIACAEGAARATGARLETEAQKGYAAMRSNGPLAGRFAEHLASLGVPIDPAPQRVRMGSTDMGDVSQALPAIHPYVSISTDAIGGHTVEFREAAISDLGQERMIAAAKAMALTAADVLTDRAFFAEVRRAYTDGAAEAASAG